MECAALRSPLTGSLKGLFRFRVWGVPGSIVVPSHRSPADLAGFVVAGCRCGNRWRFPRLSLDGRHLQTGEVGRPIDVALASAAHAMRASLVASATPTML